MSRLLLPREHGAYFQLGVPLAMSFVLTGGSIAAALFAAASIAAFLANEPMLVVLGHRGRRARDKDRERAGRMLAVMVPAAVVMGVTAMVLADWPTRLLAGALLVPTAGLVALGVHRQQRTVLGELLALVALAGAAVPVATASGLPAVDALCVLGAWIAGYGCSVLCVHRVIDRGRRPRSISDVALAALCFGIACVAALATCKTFAFAPALPLALAASIVAYVAPAPAGLRTIGFAMVGASILSMVATAAL